jgi:hypothetical protein
MKGYLEIPEIASYFCGKTSPERTGPDILISSGVKLYNTGCP